MTTMIARGPDPRFYDGRGSGCSLLDRPDQVAKLQAENARLRATIADLSNTVAALKFDGLKGLVASLDRSRPVPLTIGMAAFLFGVSRRQIVGAGRDAETVQARFAVIWAARTAFNVSHPRMARALGRDHSTIVVGFRRARQLRDSDPDFRVRSDALLQMVAAPSQEVPHAG